jgi:hypothetical protein
MPAEHSVEVLWCADCSRPFDYEYSGHGLRPQRCEDCRHEHELERNRAYTKQWKKRRQVPHAA